MLTYKDRTFCVNEDCTLDCYRKLTDEVRQGAISCGMLIATAIWDEQECKKERGLKDE